MMLSLIVAMSDGGVIGRGGRLPWRLPADMQRFAELTRGHHILMGRKTFESIGRCLPGRTSIILTRQSSYRIRGALVAHDLDDAIRQVAGDNEVFVIGGAQTYALTLPQAARLYVTAVHAEIEGDTYFPEIDWDGWRLVENERHAADRENPHDYSFQIYDRLIAA